MEAQRKKVTIPDLINRKQTGRKITLLTAYDYPQACLVDKAEIDIVMVGDSLGMVVLGYDSTVPVTMEEMIHHAKAVRRGTRYAFIVGDMPFMSYQASTEDAIRNAGRFLKEAGSDGVKLEGGAEALDKIKAIIDAGIAVMGHLGLTPQSATKLGGFKVQGKGAQSAQKIVNDARLLEGAGCFSIILECIPDELAKIVTAAVNIPTIGIGAGPWCDGQALVISDMIGLFERFTPKFVKRYVNVSEYIYKALRAYKKEVEDSSFPAREHSFTIEKEELQKLK